MHIHLNPYLLIITLSIALSSCLSTTNFETGKTMGRDVSRSDIAFCYEYSQPPVKGSWLNSNEGPFFMYSYSYGLLDKLDIGVGISTNTDIHFKTKFMLTNPESKFGVSLGASTFIVSNFEKVFFFHSNLSLYTSAHPTEDFTIYAYPQFLFFHLDEVSINNNIMNTGTSFTFGILFNKVFQIKRNNIGIGLEFSSFSAQKYQQQTLTFGLVIKRNYDTKLKKDPQYFY